jgi:hypothetical protein
MSIKVILMGKKRSDNNNLLTSLLLLAIVVSVAGVALNVALIKSVDAPLLDVTGRVTNTGTVTLTGAGSAGLNIQDGVIAIGSGYVNYTDSACQDQGYARFTTSAAVPVGANGPQGAPQCWINTTGWLNSGGLDNHQLVNNGTLVLNLSVDADTHAQDLFCGIGNTCANSSLANLTLIPDTVQEPASCITGIAAADTSVASATTNMSATICQEWDFKDNADRIDIDWNLTIPAGVTSGAKTLTLTYTAVAA